LFSASANRFGDEPNTHIDPVTLGLPGALPVLNRHAVELAMRIGLALNCTVQPSTFHRKNYFYPDMPKAYQISQYDQPINIDGWLELPGGKRIGVERAHLEEDTGKSTHIGGTGGRIHGSDYSLIDFNRAGVPLVEIVGRPDIATPDEAKQYVTELRQILVAVGASDAKMEEGSMRCDANVSVRKPGAPYGTRREIKNLNSFRFLQQAIDVEVQWQIDRVEDGLPIEQATVLFNPDAHGGRGETRAMRTKEDAHDYRYFPDPDLPPLVIAPEWVERVRGAMPELPRAMAARFERDDGLPAYDAAMMTQSLAFARYYEAVRNAGRALEGDRSTAAWPKLAANWLMGEVSKRLNAQDSDIAAVALQPATLAALIGRVVDGTVSNNGARQVFEALWSGEAADVDAVIAAKGLKQMNDSGALEAIVDEVLAKNEKSVAEFRAGKDKAFNALVGQIMKASQGKANPAQAGELLKKKLGG
jgi:aspartyl-tRNA(Asn)/glutamyl-tRNA(Gln) amidotransferase subunit B